MDLKQLEELGSYTTSKYVHDNGFELPGVGILAVGLAATAALIGFLAHFVAQWFYLIILFPVGIGVILAFVGKKIIVASKIRNIWLVATFGLVAGIAAMGAMHYMDYHKLLGAIREQGIQETPSFFEYMDLAAKQGVEIKRAARSGSGINLGYIGSLIYWLVEALIVAGIAFFGLRDAANNPFCSRCQMWKENEKHSFGFRGEEIAAKAALEKGNLAEVGKLVADADKHTDLTSFLIWAYACPKCSLATVDCQLQKIGVNKKGEVTYKKMGTYCYPGQAKNDLLKIVQFINEEEKAAAAKEKT